MKQVNQHCSLQLFCRLFGYSRQAYHKQIRLEKKQTDEQSLILQQITFIRQEQPRCGTRKLLVMLQPFLKNNDLFIGRDALFDLLAKNKMLVRKRNRNTYTTNSKHFFYRYPNLVKDFTPLHAHELWVADITYIPLKERFAYLYLITDGYSRKIVGFHVSEDMRVSSAAVALQKAIDQKPADAIPIHHSDRGIQYCSNEYVMLLNQHHIRISMTMQADPYENAMAERVNGILKTELISESYPDYKTASQHIARCITIYNYRRVHSSINWQIPHIVHQQKGPQIRKWKNYYKNKKKEEL